MKQLHTPSDARVGMRYASPDRRLIDVTTERDQFQRWNFGIDRLVIANRKAWAISQGQTIHPNNLATLQQDVGRFSRVLHLDTSLVEVTFQIDQSQRRLLGCMAEVAMADLSDPGLSSVHPDLMYGLFGGRTEDYYRDQALQIWEKEAKALGGPIKPFIASPV